MNRIRNIFGSLNTFVRGTFNYVIGNNGQEVQPVDQEEARESDSDVVEAVARPKWNSKGKKKKTRGKKKSAKRNNTPTKRHPRQKQIAVKIPNRPEPFSLEGLFKIPTKTHAPINCSDGYKKQSDELIISEKTVSLENAIKYGSKAEAIDAGDKPANRLPKQEKLLPAISNQTKTVAGVDRGVLGKLVESNNALLINEENSSFIDSKKDNVKKLSTKEKYPNEGTKATGEDNCKRAGLKLPDILSCQGSLVSQPISCSVRNPPMARALPKQLRSRIPSLLTQVQKRAFLSTLETIQETGDEKHFNSQSLTESEDKKLGKLAGENHRNSEQAVRTFAKRERESVRRESSPALNSQASLLLNKVSDIKANVDAKALGSVETTQGKEAQEKHTKANTKKEKKKKKKKKTKAKAKAGQEPKDNELAESFQPTQGNLNPISVNGKNPLERLRKIESKLLSQKQVQLGKVLCRNNKVAPLSTERAGLKKPEIRKDVNSSRQSSKVKPLLQPLKTEIPHTEIAKEFPSLHSEEVPTVLPVSSALPRIIPRCQSPKIFNTGTDQETKDHRCAGLDLGLFEYETSDEEEQLGKGNMCRGKTAEKQRPESHISPAFVYEPSDDEEENDKLKQLPKPKRKFSVQDRLRMGRKVMSLDKGCRGDRQASNAAEYCRPTEKAARADTLNVALDVVPKHMVKTSMINNNTLNYAEMTQASKQQEQRRVLPSLGPRGRSSLARTDNQFPQDHCDLKVWDLFDFEDASEWQL